jgi:hypothetical protein
MHAVMRPRLILSVNVCSVTVSGSVFGISNTAVTPPITALREPVSRSSLWVWPGLAEMHLGVDHAGQDVQALAVDHLGGRACAEPPIAAMRPLLMPMSRTPSPS